MKEIERAIHNHDCCMRPEKLFKAIEQYVIKARIQELEKVYQKSEQEECSWFKGKPTAWRTVWEERADHFKRIDKRIAELKKGPQDET